MNEWFFRLVTNDYGIHEVGVTVCGFQHVKGVRVRLGNQIVPSFSYNENSTRALNNTSLKYCLPPTDAIKRREVFHAGE